MGTHRDTDKPHRDTVLTCPSSRYHDGPRYDTGEASPESDEKRPSDGQTIYHICLGDVQETDLRYRVLSGMYVIRSMGHTRDGKDSPCWVWKGAMSKDRPILRTWLSSYSPRARIIKRVGTNGRAVMECDTPGCIRPHHMGLQTYKEASDHALKHRPPRPRDSKTGQFLPTGSHHPPDPEGP